jgi:23S rRNA (adenine-N6)-dimethyltransferase
VNVEIMEEDFLQVRICERGFKIFANIPYNITADVLRRILFLYPTPTAAYLIVQKEAAEKYSGVPNETQCSVLSKPRFRFQILHQLHRNDFEPVPRVDSVLLGIEKRSPPLIGDDEIDLYNNFIRYGFGRWRRSLKCIFKPIFTYPQWKRLSAELRFPLNATPTNLTFEQWLGLFDCFQHRVVEYKQRLIQVS